MAGEHNVPGVRSYGEIPPVGPVDINIGKNLKIKNIRAITPDEFSVERSADGLISSVRLERLDIHFAAELS